MHGQHFNTTRENGMTQSCLITDFGLPSWMGKSGKLMKRDRPIKEQLSIEENFRAFNDELLTYFFELLFSQLFLLT